MVVAIVLCHRTGILFFSCLDNFQSYHYSRTPTGSILDLTTIFRFPVDCNIHWQAMVDPMAALPIPPGHGLVDANFIGWKKFCARCSLKFLTKSSKSLQRYCSDVISDGRLGGCSLNRMHIQRSSNRFRGDRIPSTTPGAEPPRDAQDSGSARSHPTHLETSSSNRP